MHGIGSEHTQGRRKTSAIGSGGELTTSAGFPFPMSSLDTRGGGRARPQARAAFVACQQGRLERGQGAAIFLNHVKRVFLSGKDDHLPSAHPTTRVQGGGQSEARHQGAPLCESSRVLGTKGAFLGGSE